VIRDLNSGAIVSGSGVEAVGDRYARTILQQLFHHIRSDETGATRH
jgi:hypothetical protein